MIEDRTYVYAERRITENRVALYLVHRCPDGIDQEGSIQWAPRGPAYSAPRCAETLDETAAQVLMDTLWQAGVRPTDGAGSAGAMAAVQTNLADLRQEVEFLQSLVTRGPSPLASAAEFQASLQKFNEMLLKHMSLATTTYVRKEAVS